MKYYQAGKIVLIEFLYLSLCLQCKHCHQLTAVKTYIYMQICADQRMRYRLFLFPILNEI